MSATKTQDKDVAAELSKASAQADEAVQTAITEAEDADKLPVVEPPIDAQLSGSARAVASDAPSDEKAAIAHMQQFGAVPSGWVFNPAFGLRKA